MKPKTSYPKKLSLPLITFMATVCSTIFYTAFTTPIAIAQVGAVRELPLPRQRQLIAQAWSDIATEQLSLATPTVTNSQESASDELLITQLLPEERQLIAQVWSDIATEQLSLATPTVTNSQESVSDELLITQLLPQEQQLIAQVWSDIATEQLSLATPTVTNSQESASDELLITQLLPEEQQLIAQVWSDIATEQLSLATGNSDRDFTVQPEEQLLISQLDLQQQKLIAQTWSNVEIKELSLASPVDKFEQIPATTNPNPPQQETPVINPRSREEIAARIILSKVQIITPAPGVIINGEADSSVTIQYPASTTVKLEVNGKEVAHNLIANEQLDFKTNLITKTWSGTKLTEGKNQVSVIASKSGFTSETSREVIVKKDTDNVPSEPSQTPAVESSTPKTNTPQSETESEQKQPNTEPKTPAAEAKPQSSISDKFSGNLVKILTPKADEVIANVSSTVIIQYPEEASVILQVNGQSVNASQVGRTEVSPVTKLVTQTWYGVVFNTGLNNLSVLATTDGTNYSETAIKVHVPGKPKSLKVKTVESHIPADGKSIATVKGQFLDEQGKVSVWNETVTLNSSEGKFVGADLNPDRPGFQVKSQKGEFTASLQAGYDAETVTVQAQSSHLEAYTQIQFKNTLREQPLLTGFANLRIGARGTDYYDNYRDFLPLDEDNGAEVDFNSAAFITGSFGKWSYTGAFNSDRPLNEDNNGETRIFRTYSDSESGYPVYGDSSTTEVTTPSTDSVYLRLEKNSAIEFAEPDYFMWGDYNTEEFATESQEFSAISRQLHGFKSNYNLGNFQLNAFYANNAEGFQRDGIAPDGTSGFYFLSRRLLIPGSEDVYLELTPLNDPGNVVNRERLTLGLDYEIDYDRGTLLFKDPVLRTAIDDRGNVLVRRIITTYQFESETRDSTLIGGRARYHFDRDFDRPTWLGMSYLNEDRGDLDFKLLGFDAYVSLGNWGKIIAEYANSENQTIFADANGSAYRLEGEVKFTNNILGRAYYREADEGFANNATLSFVPGQKRYGGELTAKVAETTNLRFLYERQENNGVAPRPLDELEDFLNPGFDPVPGSRVDNSVSTITAGVEQKIGKADLGLDLTWRDRQDNTVSGNLNSTSTQLRSHFSIPIVDKLNFHALNDLTLSNSTDALYSDRFGLGLDWEFYEGLSLVFNHQWFTRGDLAGESLTTFGLQGEYNPWANATLTGRYNITNGIDGINNVGSIGLQQKLSLAPGLNIDFDYEHTFDSSTQNSDTGTQFAQPFSVGQSAYSLSFGSGSTYGIGIEYTDDPDFTASAKWQYSDGSGGSNTVLSAGVTGKVSDALTTLFDYNQASSANQKFDIGTTRQLRLGLAYRDPKQDKFNALLRYEYEENGGTLPETILLGNGTGSQEHLFALEGIYAPNWRWEFYGKYAFRNSKTFLADDFVGSSNISLGQIRATYRLNYHIDLAAEARMIWQPSAGYTESGFLLEAGYYLTPEVRISGGYVFGRADDEDFTGTRSAGGPYVGLTVKLNSLLDGFGQHQAPSPPEVVSKKKEKEK
ncbi:MAG: Ig-like domain-containing protein [Pleurocapsa minor HA4230-MV1]|nr:Ig-like domain-containing protein [Pleurocapsa minor HA4230-MV1]